MPAKRQNKQEQSEDSSTWTTLSPNESTLRLCREVNRDCDKHDFRGGGNRGPRRQKYDSDKLLPPRRCGLNQRKTAKLTSQERWESQTKYQTNVALNLKKHFDKSTRQ